MTYKKYFKKFIKQLDIKLKRGEKEYGDNSFYRSNSELLGELEQECIDLAGWGLILYSKLQEIKNRRHYGS